MKHYIQNFERWLKLLNYAESTVKSSTKQTEDFLNYLKLSGISNIQEIENRHLQAYYRHLKTKSKQSGKGALSQNYIISNINSIKRFAKYLRESKGLQLPVNIRPERIQPEITILTPEEISALYKACDESTFGSRDRAMLSVYYGCGLRRNEGLQLNVGDILPNKKLLLVRRGKGFRQRYVPMNEAVRQDVMRYIRKARPLLIKEKTEALFISQKGRRIGGNAMADRLKQLRKKAGIEKACGLHSLRHSIATHLLQSGMSLENVSRFLGHQSLESTQIYTHLAHETI